MIKDFLSAQSDTIRLAYGKREFEYLRQSVMAGTSNEHDYLTDPTSVRRYWIIKLSELLGELNPIDFKKLEDEVHLLWGEAYQAYLDLREAQPHGSLHLGLKSREAILEQREIAEGSRRVTVTETIAEVIQEYLDTPHTASDVILDESGFAADDNDMRQVVRNMVTAKDAYEALRNEPILESYRNADVRTFGKALAIVKGWRCLGKVRRFAQPPVAWFCREFDGKMWVEAPAPRDEIDDLLG